VVVVAERAMEERVDSVDGGGGGWYP